MWTSYSVSGWDLVKLSFLSYFYASYYDIGVPCKLLPPCQVDRSSLFAVFLFLSDVVDDMMGFYLAVFQGLRVQMGIPAIQHTISIFLELFTR